MTVEDKYWILLYCLTPVSGVKYIEEDVKKEYVLIYEIHNNPRLDDYAKRFAAHVGLPLVRVSPTFHQLARGADLCFVRK